MYDNLDSNIPSPMPPRKAGWRRFFLWTLLGTGVLFFLALVLLIALTVPNLRREVAPPEVSGAHRVAPSKNAPDRPTVPTSGTLSVSVSTSGTSPLNLDDFPHLSPTMRKMTQDWLDRCAETDRALAAIADPTLRAQAAELLKDRGNMRAFLNLPIEWENQSFEEAKRRLWEWLDVPEGDTNTYLPPFPYSLWREKGDDFPWQKQLFETYPEFYKAIGDETAFFTKALGRMNFELYVCKGNDWKAASEFSMWWGHERYRFQDPNSQPVSDPIVKEWARSSLQLHEEMDEQYSWDEKVYCLRQMGIKGLPLLTVGSYQHVLDTHAGNPENLFYRDLQGAGEWATRKLMRRE